MVRLNSEVQKMMDEADRLYEEIVEGKGKGDEKEAESSGTAESTQQVPEEGSQSTPQETQEEAPSPPQQVDEDYKHKYEVLKGKYDAEVPRLNQRLNETLKLVDELRQELLTLRQAKAQEEQRPPSKQSILEALKQDPNIQFISHEYPDVWKGVESAISKVTEYTIGEIAKLQEKLSNTESRAIKTERDRFYDTLDLLCKDWESINVSPEFEAWLEVKDRYTGKTRRQLLLDAYNNFDAHTAANFFNDFLSEQKRIKEKPKETLNVAPKAKPSPTPEPKAGVEYIDALEIEKFYRDLNNGLYRGREEEARKLEAKYEKAMVEGRIRVK